MRGLMALLPQLQSSTWPHPHTNTENTIRVATYNIRVDHDADDGTGHEWAQRRPLAARAIADLDCDIVLLQEPSPPCARELEAALGGAYRVATTACDPRAGAGRGQARDGNGFAWRPDRVALVGDLETLWLSETTRAPAPGEAAPWDASPYARTAVSARFRARSRELFCVSAHFDHADVVARRASARLVMDLAAKAEADVTTIVGGDFNTFADADVYGALAAAGAPRFSDVRDAAAAVYDFGVGDASWRGWPGGPFCRDALLARHGPGGSRFDHLFVDAPVAWTGVVEADAWRDASDHAPIVAEILLA